MILASLNSIRFWPFPKHSESLKRDEANVKKYMEDINMTIDELTAEIKVLKQKNQLMEAQLQYFQELFGQLQQLLTQAGHVAAEADHNQLVRSLLRDNLRLKNQLLLEQLTNREKEVLQFITDGLTSREIAQRMEISKLTVDTYRKHIQRKLKVSNVAELVRLVEEA
ncbi:MAG: LuxR C-terminal-related transcriptional regulator [Bacteroidota bacterium]